MTTLIDRIVTRTDWLNPVIRHDDCAVVIVWPYWLPSGNRLTTVLLADMTGVDRELFHVRPLRGTVELHVPAGIA